MTEAVLLYLKVAPKSSRNAVTGWIGNMLMLSVTIAPEKGKANQVVIDVLAQARDIPRSSVGIAIVRSETAATKIVEIQHLAETEVYKRLNKPTA